MEIKFEEKVYQIVRKIPRGKVLAYKQVAEKLGNKNLTRAVGNALSKNRDSRVPCHRVIRNNGKIGGYNRGEKKKIGLLIKEGLKIKKSRLISGVWQRVATGD